MRKKNRRGETGIQQKYDERNMERLRGKTSQDKKKSIKTIKEDRLVEPEIRETRSGSNVSSLNDY